MVRTTRGLVGDFVKEYKELNSFNRCGYCTTIVSVLTTEYFGLHFDV